MKSMCPGACGLWTLGDCMVRLGIECRADGLGLRCGEEIPIWPRWGPAFLAGSIVLYTLVSSKHRFNST